MNKNFTTIGIIFIFVFISFFNLIQVSATEDIGLDNDTGIEDDINIDERSSTADVNTSFERVIVTFEDQIEENILEDFEAEDIQVFRHIKAAAMTIPFKFMEAVKNHPTIKSVEVDKPVEITANQTIDWGVRQVKAPQAWESGYTGKNVDIAIIDTGVVTDHEDLKVHGGKSFVAYTSSYEDDHGHGTHIAGIIGAKDTDVGVVGVSPDARLYALKAIDADGVGSTSDIIAALDWCITNEMDIINLSFGTDNHSQILEEMLDEVNEKGILVVAAAGNKGSGTVEYPAKYDSVIAVASTSQSNEKAFFSATGGAVEVAAPGEEILSTGFDNSYVKNSGTSASAAFVTGNLALLKEKNPDKNYRGIRTLLQNSSLDLGEPGRDSHFGYGLIQAPHDPGSDFSFFEVTSNDLSVYQNREGKLIRVGTLPHGEVYPRIRDYGGWHEISIAGGYGYVWKEGTRPASEVGLRNLNEGRYKPTAAKFRVLKEAMVYDNTSDRLVPFATLSQGQHYPIVSDYGNWYRIDVAGRIGYIHKNNAARVFTLQDRYFKVTNKSLAIYQNRNGKLVQVGTLHNGQVYPRIRDYGGWHEISFAGEYGYVWKEGTRPANRVGLRNLNEELYKPTAAKFRVLKEAAVYDNTSGRLIPFATLSQGQHYPIVSDYGNWYRIDVAGRIGYIYKNNVERIFTPWDRYFEVTTHRLPLYQNRNGKLVQVGTLLDGEIYPRIRDYGGWHEISFAGGYGYVWKEGTRPSSRIGLRNLNEGGYKPTAAKFRVLQEATVYDNTSGRLIPFATLSQGQHYPIVSDYGNWYRIDVAGRIGYIYKNNVK